MSVIDNDIAIAISPESSREPVHDVLESQTEAGELSDELNTLEVIEDDGEREEDGAQGKRSFA